MTPQDYLSTEEQSHDLTISGRIQDIAIEQTQLAARGADMTDLEARQSDTLATEFDTLEAQQKKLHLDGRTRYMNEAAVKGAQVYRGDGADADPFGEPDSIEDRSFNDPWNVDEMRSYPFDGPGRVSEIRARALSAVEKMQGVNDSRRQAMAQIIERWDDKDGTISQIALATSSPAYLSFWSKRLRYGDGAVLDAAETQAAQRAMSLTDAAGGFLIPFQLDPNVIITSDGSLNQIRQAARQVVATGDIWNGVSSAAVSFSWDAEEAEVSDDATTFAQPAIPIYKGAGFIPISIEALQDEANVTTEIGNLLAFGKDTQDAAAFATGTGSAQPTGIVVALTGGASEVDSATTDVFAIADVYATQGGLPARYRPRASWLANNAIYNLVRQFDTGGGGGFWENLTSERPALLMGKPALESEDMDGDITALAANLVLIFGDFSNYVIADRIGMTVETVPHLFGTPSNLPTGQRGFYAHYRLGADSVNDGAFSMLDVT